MVCGEPLCADLDRCGASCCHRLVLPVFFSAGGGYKQRLCLDGLPRLGENTSVGKLIMSYDFSCSRGWYFYSSTETFFLKSCFLLEFCIVSSDKGLRHFFGLLRSSVWWWPSLFGMSAVQRLFDVLENFLAGCFSSLHAGFYLESVLRPFTSENRFIVGIRKSMLPLSTIVSLLVYRFSLVLF